MSPYAPYGAVASGAFVASQQQLGSQCALGPNRDKLVHKSSFTMVFANNI